MALSGATAAHAAEDDQAESASGNPAVASEDAGEIIVTALRNRQSAQQTSAAVTVASGDLIARAKIDDVRGLQALTPSTRISAQYTSTRILVRGIGSVLDFYWIPELTATNFNGIYMPRFTVNGAMYDIDSAQLLPGPQGVLYGHSAGGGALLINPKRPVMDNEGSGSVSYGNYDDIRLEGMANLGISETLAIRAAGFFGRNDGYQSNNMMSDDALGGRLSLLWKPTTDLSFYLWATHYRQKGTPAGTQYRPFVDPSRPWYIPPNDPITGLTNLDGFDHIRYSILGYETTYSLGEFEVNYRGSYMYQDEVARTKLTGNNRTVDNAQRQYTQDLTLKGKVGIVDLIGGASYLHADSRYDVRFGPNQFGNILPDINNTSYSFFGQATVAATDQLRLIGGGRWSSDHLSLAGTGNACFAVCNRPPISFSKTWRNFDWKAGFEFDAADRVMVYGYLQTGYAPGTLNTFTNTVALNKEIRPQSLTAYTGGVKSQLLDRLLTLNLEVYNYQYKNLVIQDFNSQVGAQTLYNMPKARIYGGQAELGIKPWKGGTISGTVAYTHGRYGNYRTSATSPNLDGFQMQLTPDWSGSVAVDQSFELSNGAHVDARVSTYFSSSFWGTFNHVLNSRQSAYTKTDASITWYAPGDRFHIGAWARNLENSAVASTRSALSPVVPPYTALTFLEPPRTYGVKAGFKF